MLAISVMPLQDAIGRAAKPMKQVPMKPPVVSSLLIKVRRTLGVWLVESTLAAGTSAHRNKTRHAISLMAFLQSHVGDTTQREDLCEIRPILDAERSDLVPSGD